jgi:hypothetical protein
MTAHTKPVTPTRDVYDRERMLQLIEDAMRNDPYCACGSLMTVDAQDDTLWLECPSFTQPKSGRLGWLRGGIRIALHEREVIAREVSLAA